MNLNPDQAVDVVARIPVVATILEVICRTTGMGFAAVACVTDTRWVACGVRDEVDFGLEPGSELPIALTFCDQIRATRTPIVFADAARDPRYSHHPVALHYKLQSYVSYPIILPDGSVFGTLCAMDAGARPVDTPVVLAMFRLFADLLAFHLDAQIRLEEAEADLHGKVLEAELRERFIAVLSHDLRNPLASISAGLRMLRRTPAGQEDQAQELLGLMEGSVTRMSKLIGDVTDFARTRLGGGFGMTFAEVTPVEPVLAHVFEELRLVHPERRIDVDIAPATLVCDAPRLEQIVSNLLGNALTHGDADGTVTLHAGFEGSSYVVRVSNPGPAIPPEAMDRLFTPFMHGTQEGRGNGLGLGLFIAAQLAQAHGGTLTAASESGQNVFTLRLPFPTPPL